ncbi:hypothetical protein HJC23_005685 [Cyclotella cryptica]|uniref:Nucleotide exchange factor SIL1 n=1 Tax=Cyclotella cryptica TaxID=29204 RepID=A0ABD3PF97_9STRA|eukprot:CCRYP_015550-RA/>CCRYP_015550-RA protein AED:0.24 eAED:0.24 QI:0/-1/0/1/-1/1/1/0/634
MYELYNTIITTQLLPHRSPTMRRTTLLLLLLHCLRLNAKEITGTNTWQLLGENDTVPPGLHIKLDLSTGERWARLVQDDDGDSAFAGVEVHDTAGALAVSPSKDTAHEKSDEEDVQAQSQPERDYEMMHRVMSRLPPEELDRFGGLPALPLPHSRAGGGTGDKDAAMTISPEERHQFELRMEALWQLRQEELRKFQEEYMVDLPSLLKERIEVLKLYLGDPVGERRKLLKKREQLKNTNPEVRTDEDEAETVTTADNIIECLKDLEYQLSDVDMTRDFHTLGGWPLLVMLLQDQVHSLHCNHQNKNVEKDTSLVYEIESLAAMTIGTAVSNLEEFRPWALEDVSSVIKTIMRDSSRNEDGCLRSEGDASSSKDSTYSTVLDGPISALSLLTESFQMEVQRRSSSTSQSAALLADSNTNNSFRTSKLRAVYALGSLLRGNSSAQQQFLSDNGPDALVRYALGILSTVNGDEGVTKSDYKFASRVLALGEDVVMDVILQEEDYINSKDENNANNSEMTVTPNQMVAAFTTEPWCDLSLRMLSPPVQLVGVNQARSIKERALSAVRALGPGCRENLESQCKALGSSGECTDDGQVWGVPQVLRVKAEWNREGSGDGLDSVYRRELLDLVDSVLEALK